MLKIFKYRVKDEPFDLELPKGSTILSMGTKKELNAVNTAYNVDVPYIWVLVNPENAKEKRRFVVYDTGEEIDTISNKEFVGTWIEGGYVYHLFEILHVPQVFNYFFLQDRKYAFTIEAKGETMKMEIIGRMDEKGNIDMLDNNDLLTLAEIKEKSNYSVQVQGNIEGKPVAIKGFMPKEFLSNGDVEFTAHEISYIELEIKKTLSNQTALQVFLLNNTEYIFLYSGNYEYIIVEHFLVKYKGYKAIQLEQNDMNYFMDLKKKNEIIPEVEAMWDGRKGVLKGLKVVEVQHHTINNANSSNKIILKAERWERIK